MILYYMVSPFSYSETVTLMVSVFNKVGTVKKTFGGKIVCRYNLTPKGGFWHSVKTECVVQEVQNNPSVVIKFKDGAFSRVQDKRWYRIIDELKVLRGDVDFGITIPAEKPKIVKKIHETENEVWYLYDNGRIKTKTIWFPANTPSSRTNRGIGYERLVAKYLSSHGFHGVTVTKASGDFGADIILTDKDGSRMCVQCKQYSKPVGIRAVQEVVGARAYYHCTRAAVITTSTFTPAAEELAQKSGVELYENFYPKSKDDLDWIDRMEEIDSIIE